MAEVDPGTDTSKHDEGAGDELILISANRSSEEKRDAYEVKWREPANERSLADRVRDLL